MLQKETLDEKVARLSAKMRSKVKADFLATLQARIAELCYNEAIKTNVVPLRSLQLPGA